MIPSAAVASLVVSRSGLFAPPPEALQGRWALVAIVTPDSRVDYEGKPSYSLIVSKERMRLVQGRGQPGWNYAYKVAAAPNGLDFSSRKDGRFPVAYSLVGDRLTIAFPEPNGTERPKALAIGKGCALVLVFKRTQPR